jgi:hypothetical protein
LKGETKMEKRPIWRCIHFASLVILSSNAAFSQDCYKSYDFEDSVSSEWSHTSTYQDPSWLDNEPPIDRTILGPFWNDTVRLSLDNLPEHTEVTISLDLCLMWTWDGWNDMFGPDIFGLRIVDGPNLIHANFANWDGHKQTWPEAYPGGDYPARTGADEEYPSGVEWDYRIMLSVYHASDDGSDGVDDPLSFTFAHTADSIEIEFYGQGLQTDYKEWGMDEGWGIDNVCVTLNSAPAGTLSGYVWMDASGDLGYSLEEGDLLYFYSYAPVFYFNFTTGVWSIEGPVDWTYVSWPFIYELDSGDSWFAWPPEDGLWVYHFSTGQWEVLPRIIP